MVPSSGANGSHPASPDDLLNLPKEEHGDVVHVGQGGKGRGQRGAKEEYTLEASHHGTDLVMQLVKCCIGCCCHSYRSCSNCCPGSGDRGLSLVFVPLIILL